MNHFLAVGLGGFFGALLRALLTQFFNRFIPHTIPIGTLATNILGSFLLTLFISSDFPKEMELFLVVGFGGALSTYSTFALETFLLFKGKKLNAFKNILYTVAGTLFSVFFALYLCR